RNRLMLTGAIVAVVIIGVAIWLAQWWLCLLGLALLGSVGVLQPAIWLAALLLGLPFYFGVTLPILPGRHLGIIDVGVLGGMATVGANWGLHWWRSRGAKESRSSSYSSIPLLFLWFIIAWAFASAINAEHQSLALREWRTVFLAAGILGLLLQYTLKNERRTRVQSLLLFAWLAGASLMALIALWQFASGSMLITAEGVYRVRGLYGSPNNLALYLERTLAVALALTLFGVGRQRLLWGVLAAVQLVALLLTFSKGGILLGLPAALVTLMLVGLMGQRAQFPARRVGLIVAAVALLALLIVTPFLGTERFQRLLDFSQGTGFIRLQLWRSAWQMALDHPLLGVGPDNFLYAYRSDYLLPAAWQEPNLNHPHQFFLDWWTRLGLPGLVLGLLFFGAGLRRLWRVLNLNVHKANVALKSDMALYAGLLAAAAAGLAHGLIDVSYALPDLMIVWVLLFLLPNQYTEDRNSSTNYKEKNVLGFRNRHFQGRAEE
ncbi:MAG: O-antigen ligase family protein, partial [Caldilineaceae bacterium]|nr:O-antigen ligase family protein [Caldilineaceae bacterium]MCB0146008.1 O-antigen ligase family protein [Caldilineaceae bacterium]